MSPRSGNPVTRVGGTLLLSHVRSLATVSLPGVSDLADPGGGRPRPEDLVGKGASTELKVDERVDWTQERNDQQGHPGDSQYQKRFLDCQRAHSAGVPSLSQAASGHQEAEQCGAEVGMLERRNRRISRDPKP